MTPGQHQDSCKRSWSPVPQSSILSQAFKCLRKRPQYVKSEVWRGSSSAVPQCLVKGAFLLCWELEGIALGACSKAENRQRKEQQRQEQNLYMGVGQKRTPKQQQQKKPNQPTKKQTNQKPSEKQKPPTPPKN